MHATQEWVEANPDYAWSTQVDAMGLVQLLEQWSAARGAAGGDMVQHDPDRLSASRWRAAVDRSPGPAWCDSDRRLGVWLDLVEAQGLLDDHDDPADRGPRHGRRRPRLSVATGTSALTAAGIPFRDEAYGWIYLG